MVNFLGRSSWLVCGAAAIMVLANSGCSSDDTTGDTNDGTDDGSTPTAPTTDEVTPTVALTCDEIATKFVTRGSANADLAEPEVSAVCANDTVTVTANGIPDFPYIETSPGVPEANVVDYVFPATPTPADDFTEIPIVGEIGVAINGVPIYGPTEGPGGDVNARPGGFTECGGHNGPTGYHYHIFDVTGSDYCLFTEGRCYPGASAIRVCARRLSYLLGEHTNIPRPGFLVMLHFLPQTPGLHIPMLPVQATLTNAMGLLMKMATTLTTQQMHSPM